MKPINDPSIFQKIISLFLQADDPKPEVLDDWDPRFVVTTLSSNLEGNRITLNQVAEKDMAFRQDSCIDLEVDNEDRNMMIMTCTAGDIIGMMLIKSNILKVFLYQNMVFIINPKF